MSRSKVSHQNQSGHNSRIMMYRSVSPPIVINPQFQNRTQLARNQGNIYVNRQPQQNISPLNISNSARAINGNQIYAPISRNSQPLMKKSSSRVAIMQNQMSRSGNEQQWISPQPKQVTVMQEIKSKRSIQQPTSSQPSQPSQPTQPSQISQPSRISQPSQHSQLSQPSHQAPQFS